MIVGILLFVVVYFIFWFQGGRLSIDAMNTWHDALCCGITVAAKKKIQHEALTWGAPARLSVAPPRSEQEGLCIRIAIQPFYLTTKKKKDPGQKDPTM